jgi:hypothetical protein
MKSLLTILFLVYSFAASAGSTLNISMFSCKTEGSDTAYDIQIYKDGEFVKDIHLSFYSNFETTLSNIEKGIYCFKFTNIYKQQITDSLVISRDTLYWKFLCSDDYIFERPFRGYVDSLKNTESFFIEFQSYGCYHWEMQKIKVFKEDNQYFSTLYPEKKSEKTELKK